GPRSRHTSHESKSMIEFLQEYNLAKLSKNDEQTLHYLVNKCPLADFTAESIKDHELDD
ncbi:12603_t:CDS:1, partial [Funneliformis geosporum]